MVEQDPASGPQEFPGLSTSSEVTTRATGGGNYWTLLVVVVGVVALVVGLSLLGGSDPGEDGEVAEVDRTLPTLPGFFTTTTSAPTTVAPTPTFDSTPQTTLVPGQFLLGEPTGLWLFYGGRDPLQRINLDNGELIEYGLQAFPVVATGGDLVLHQATAGVSGWVAASQPAQQALGWKGGPVAPGDDGQLWILDRSTDEPHPSGQAVGSGRWELFDTAENRVLERRSGDLYEEIEPLLAESQSIGGRFAVLRPGPALSTRPDGGVYRFDDLGYQRIASGRVFTLDERQALVGDCPESGPCAFSWIDPATGAGLDQALPAGRPIFAELLADGRWLRTIGPLLGSELLDLRTGAVLQYGPEVEATISPDGRWLATLSGDELVLADLMGNQDSVTYRGLKLVDGGDLLFVPRSAAE